MFFSGVSRWNILCQVFFTFALSVGCWWSFIVACFVFGWRVYYAKCVSTSEAEKADTHTHIMHTLLLIGVVAIYTFVVLLLWTTNQKKQCSGRRTMRMCLAKKSIGVCITKLVVFWILALKTISVWCFRMNTLWDFSIRKWLWIWALKYIFNTLFIHYIYELIVFEVCFKRFLCNPYKYK